VKSSTSFSDDDEPDPDRYDMMEYDAGAGKIRLGT
jgi:hypothetical protein